MSTASHRQHFGLPTLLQEDAPRLSIAFGVFSRSKATGISHIVVENARLEVTLLLVHTMLVRIRSFSSVGSQWPTMISTALFLDGQSNDLVATNAAIDWEFYSQVKLVSVNENAGDNLSST